MQTSQNRPFPPPQQIQVQTTIVQTPNPPPSNIQFAPARAVQFVNQNPSLTPINLPLPQTPIFPKFVRNEEAQQFHGTIIQNLNKMSTAKMMEKPGSQPQQLQQPQHTQPQSEVQSAAQSHQTIAQNRGSDSAVKTESQATKSSNEQHQSQTQEKEQNSSPNAPISVPVEMLKSSIVIERQVAANQHISELSQLAQQQSDSKRDIAQIYSKVAAKQGEINEIRDRSSNSHTHSETAQHNNDLTSSPQKNDWQAKASLKEQADVIESLKKTIQTLQFKLAKKKQKVSNLKSEVAQKTQQLTAAEELKIQVQQLQGSMRDHEVASEESEKRYLQAIAESISFKNEALSVKSALETANSEIQNLRDQISYLKFEAQEKEALQERLNELDTELTKEKEVRESLTREAAKKELENVNISSLADENERLNSEVMRLRSMVSELNLENEDYHKTLSQTEVALQKLGEKMTSKTASLAKVEAEKKTLEEKVLALEAETETLRTKLSQKENAIENASPDPRNAEPDQKISNLIVADLDPEFELDSAPTASQQQEISALQQELMMLSDQLMNREYKIQKLKIERFEAMTRLVFALSEVERLRNRHIPF